MQQLELPIEKLRRRFIPRLGKQPRLIIEDLNVRVNATIVIVPTALHRKYEWRRDPAAARTQDFI